MKRGLFIALILGLVFLGTGRLETVQANAISGQWDLGPVFPFAPIHMMVLPDGKVMFYPGNGGINGDQAKTWDPTTGTISNLSQAGYDLFCSGHAPMKDGKMFITGGHVENFVGLPKASIYDPFTNVWTPLPDMNAGRWYPTTTRLGLPQGDMLVMTGFIDTVQGENPLPQVWQPSTGTWRDLTNAVRNVYNYSMVFSAPFDVGKVIVVGPRRRTLVLDTAGAGSWTSHNVFNFPNNRDYGSAVMYDPWNILIAGGGQPPTNTAEILVLGNPNNLIWQNVGSMAFPRRHLNLTLLPDENVLANGGTSANGFNNTSQPVLAAESWNPNSKVWTTLASQTIGRFYHSTALLLADGRVISAGGDFTYQTEIFSPPYLFKGPRPTIANAPAQVSYKQQFFVETPDVDSIIGVRLIALPAVTHAFDQNQRFVRLKFTKVAGGLNVTAPEFRSKAPPGHHYLFITTSNGVPSVAKIIKVQ